MEGVSYNLKAGVTIDTLFGNIDKTQDAEKYNAIQEALKDGKVTEDELVNLQALGLNTDAITSAKNSTKSNGTAPVAKKDITAKVQDLLAKYQASASGDIYSASNPSLQKLQEALNDGVIAQLGVEGYSKNEIVDIVSQVFNVGIKNLEGGKYQVPYGHGAEAREIFQQFSTELLKAAGDSEEIKASKAKIANLNNQIRNNNRSMQALEVAILSLQEAIEQNIEKAIEQSKDIKEEHKDATNDAVQKRLQQYTDSNGEMTYEEFQHALNNDLDGIANETDSALAKTVATMLQAETKMSTLNSQLGKMKGLMDLNAQLSADVAAEQINLQELIEAQSTTPDADCSPCDPIGFVKDNVRYDFFIDTDNNSKLSNENEFLGAKDGFNEMRALDTKDVNGQSDGVVDLEEMTKAGVKVVVTNPDGSQEVKDVAEAFPDGISIDLQSYNAAGTQMDNGNTLLGTFDVKFGENTTIEGYQTLDELDWLDANYEFSDKIEGAGRYVQGEETAIESLDYSAKYAEMSEKTNVFRQQMDEIWDKIGVDKTSVQSITDIANKEAAQKAAQINADFEEMAKKRAEYEANEQAELEAEAEAAAQVEAEAAEAAETEEAETQVSTEANTQAYQATAADGEDVIEEPEVAQDDDNPFKELEEEELY